MSVVPLAEAVERYKQEPGASDRAYSTYRQDAARLGVVSLGDWPIPVAKQGRLWTVDEADLEAALTRHRKRRANLSQMAADYKTRILHEGTVQISGGGYTVRGDFHFIWNDQERARKRSDGFWRCNHCWAPASTEHNREECHACQDWNGCGRDCTLSRVHCPACGTSLAI